MFDKTDAHWGQYDFLQTVERVTTFYYLVGQVWIPRNHHNVLHSRGRRRHKEIPRGLLLWRVFGEEPLPSRQNSHSSVLLPQSPVLRHCQTSVSTGTGYRKHSHYIVKQCYIRSKYMYIQWSILKYKHPNLVILN